METNKKKGITSRGWFIVLMLIIFFPVGLFFMWKNKVFPMAVRVIITGFFVLIFITSVIFGSNTDESANTNPDTKTEETKQIEEVKESEEDTKKEEEETTPKYDSQFKNDFVALVDEVSGEITGEWDLIAADDGTNSLVAGVLIENNEETVNGFLESLKTLISNSDECQGAVITFGDISQGEDGEVLLIASIENDEISESMVSNNFKTAHNQWIQGQFSAWDGSHIELTRLIKQSLNDEKSYKHINTTYRDIKTEEDVAEINKILSDAGKNTTVKEGDLFIMTEFSAKNGFNATIKSKAYGVASYENNSITLIAIE